MKKVFLAACLFALSLPLTLVGQNATEQLKDYTQLLSGNGIELTLIHINPKTAAVLFQPPTLYSMRARSTATTMLYVQGEIKKDVEFDSTNFTLTQGADSLTGKPSNISHFEKAKLSKGTRIDGILDFGKPVDLSKPFTIKHGPKDSVEFKFTEAQVTGMAPAAAAAK